MAQLEAWYIDSSDEDQRKPHRLNPNQPVSLEELKKIGVLHWKVSYNHNREFLRKKHKYYKHYILKSCSHSLTAN